jgi:DNA gyrase inhibitor GyrI
MNNNKVQICKLGAMRVASSHGFGASPEEQAHKKLLKYVQGRKLQVGPGGLRWFGFNNPDPTPASPNYGYEYWVEVGADVSGEGEIEIKEVPGGTYAVLHCESLAVIGERWQQLVQWVEASPYQIAPGHCLEEHLAAIDAPLEDYRFDLYLPVEA